MGIIIREADIDADRTLLLDTLLRNRDHGDNNLRRLRFAWSYFQNPFGKPRAWLALDQSSDRVIGMVVAFPRQIVINGALVTGWNGGDTSIDPEFRTLGVAIKLRRAVKESVDRGELAFLYSHPVDRMAAVLEKIGHRNIGRFTRHGVLLRADQALQKLAGANGVAGLMSGLANLVLPIQWNHRLADSSVRLRLQVTKSFGSEYDELFSRASRNCGIAAVRDSRFLHWRFIENPGLKDFSMFRLESQGELRGYAIVGFEGKAARLHDYLVDGDRFALRSLLLGLIRWLRSRRVCTFALRALPSSPLLAEAKPMGFIFKDHTDAQVSIYAGENELKPTLMDEKNWFMTQADRDV